MKKKETSNGLTAVISYLYDSNGEAYGFTYNNKTYFYVKDLQGDVGGIIGATDNIAFCGIIYDAWGKMTYDFNEDLTEAEREQADEISVINNIAYRGYFYDSETGLYYLQSRYYDPETGRFINADDTAYIGYDDTPISANIFAYCGNNPIKNIDPSGYVAISSALVSMAIPYLASFVLSVLSVAICNTIINTYNIQIGFQNSWYDLINKLNSSAYTKQAKLNLASSIIWNWTKIKVLTSAKAAQLATEAVIADAKIRTKVKKNSKERYWKATLSNTLEYVTLGKGITFTEAVNEVKAKRSVFCIFKSDARLVARRASKDLYGVDGYYADDPHCKSKRFAYKHYHVYNHKNAAHIWYLFD